MEWVETTGKTIEEAKDAALDQLGVDEHDAEFEVLEEPKMGLFGRLRSEARVRARVAPTTPRAKEDRRDRKRRGARPGTSGEPTGETGERAERPARAQGEGRDRPRGSGGRGRTGGAGRGSGSDRDGAPARGGRSSNGGSHVDDIEVPLPEQGAIAERFLQGLLTEFGAQGAVAIREVDEDTIELVVSGEELSTLIGPKGSTLAALQEVTRTVVQRKTGARNGRILVDVSGYRARRREALAGFTRQVADQVISSGVAKALEPMTPADRKVVHDTVNDIEGVRTSSQGEEPRRRVVISPDPA